MRQAGEKEGAVISLPKKWLHVSRLIIYRSKRENALAFAAFVVCRHCSDMSFSSIKPNRVMVIMMMMM